MQVPRSGVLHPYADGLTAFEYRSCLPSSQNLLILIGGLFDGLGTIPYTESISDALPSTWSLAQPILTSSYKGWGMTCLQQDVNELSKCVAYFRSLKKGKIVLLGSSTGCQDVMEYLTGSGSETRAPIDGAIIQAPVSDREAITMHLDPQIYTQSCLAAQSRMDAGRGEEVLSLHPDITRFFPCPISARRWLSLASPNKDGDDDYFSSDLTRQQLTSTFGMLPARTPLCVLISGADEYIPKNVDKILQLKRWITVIQNGEGKIDLQNSGILDGATHNLENNTPEIVGNFVARVMSFLSNLETSLV